MTTIPAQTAEADLVFAAPPEGIIVQTVNLEALRVSYEAAEEFENSSVSDNTRRAYASDWAAFERWCERVGVPALPASRALVKTYLADQAGTATARGLSPATLTRRVAAVNAQHLRNGHLAPGVHPDVRRTLTGIRRVNARPTRRMSPLLLDSLRVALSAIDTRSFPHGAIGVRDQALLLVGFAGGFRRSELAELRGCDVMAHQQDGLHIRIRTSKTDQEGDGQTKAFPYGRSPLTCAPCAVARWRRVVAAADDRPALMQVLRELPASHICREAPAADRGDETPFFRRVNKVGAVGPSGISGHAINLRIKTRIEAVGMDPEFFGGHSLRSGFVTQAFRSGVTAHEIMRQTGHRNPATLEVYSRENDPMRGNAVTKLGL